MIGVRISLGQARMWRLASFVSILIACIGLTPISASVIKEDNSTLAADVGVPLYVWSDSAFTNPKAIIVAVHGSAQQGGSMNTLATSLAQLGYFVVAPDVRGHGRWPVSSQAQTSAYDDLVQSTEDVTKILRLLQGQYPKTNIFCLGESIGAGIVLSAVANAPRKVKGVILCSAGVKPHMHNPLNLGKQFLTGMAHLVQPVDMRNYLSRYSSDDSRVTEEMINDPLGKNQQTGLELLGTFNFLSQEPGLAAAVPSNIRALVIQGDKDQILEPESADQIYSALRTKKKTFLMIPGAGHVLVGSSFIKPSVLSAIQTWIAKNNAQ